MKKNKPNGKGDTYRPIDPALFGSGWERIFGGPFRADDGERSRREEVQDPQGKDPIVESAPEASSDS